MLNCEACHTGDGVRQISDYRKVLNALREPRYPAAARLRYLLIAAIWEREQALLRRTRVGWSFSQAIPAIGQTSG